MGFIEEVEAWEKMRVGKFTASEIHRLMGSGKAKEKLFSDDAMTYIYEVASEILTGEKNDSFLGNAATEWGHAHEPIAVADFERITFTEVVHYGSSNPMFFELEQAPQYAGGSPDFETDLMIGEVKCPKNPSIHLNRVFYKDFQCLKQKEPKIYGQIQFNMLCRKKQKGVFVSFDPRMKSEKTRIKIIYMDIDYEYLNTLMDRLLLAVSELETILFNLGYEKDNK